MLVRCAWALVVIEKPPMRFEPVALPDRGDSHCFALKCASPQICPDAFGARQQVHTSTELQKVDHGGLGSGWAVLS